MPTSFLLSCGLAGLFVVLIFTILWLASIVALMRRDQVQLLDKLEKLAQGDKPQQKDQAQDGFFQEAEQTDSSPEHTDSEEDFDDDWDDDDDWEECNAEEDNEEDWEECDDDDEDDEEWNEYDEDEATWDDDEDWDEYDDDDIEDEEK
jgi:hypothetical protein